MVLSSVQIGPVVIDPAIFIGIITAIAIIIIGYFIGAIIGFVVKKGVEKTKIEKWIEKTGRLDALGGMEPPALVGALVKWWVFSIVLFISADSIIGLETVSNFLRDVAGWIPQLLIGIVILIAGLIIADFAADSISKAKKFKGIKLISPLVRILIIIYFLTIALEVIGLKVVLAQTTLLILVAGIVLALSLAIGIGFGFAFRKTAEKLLTNLEKKL